MPRKSAEPRRRWPLGNYGLALVLGALFLGSWIAQFVVQLANVKQENQQHGEEFQWADFWSQFWHSTLENWQSEFLQLLTFVVLTTYFIYRGSAESKDGDEEIHAALERIEAKVDALERASSKARP